MSLTILSPPATEPVSLSDAKAHLRITHDLEDALIGALITAARERVEADLGVALITTGFREEGLAGAGGLTLSRGPAVVIDAVSTASAAGAWTVLSAGQWSDRLDGSPYFVGVVGVALAPCHSLRVDYHAGYGAAPADVPAGLRQAILAMVAEAYAAREADPPARPSLQAAAPWLAPFRRARL